MSNNQQQLLEELLTQDANFNRFVAMGNELALRCISNNVNNIMHIVGTEFSGKTHLLKSWVNQAKQNGDTVQYLDCRLDVQDLNPDIKFIAIDNIEEMSNEMQNSLFDLYNQVKLYNKAIYVLTSSTAPIESLGLREDLATRIMSGFVIYLKSVEDQDLFVALKQYVKLECLNIGDIELKYLITHCTRNLGALIKLIQDLSLYGTAEKKPITLSLIKQYLQHNQDI